MHLATILAVVLTFVISLNGPQQPTDAAGVKLMLACLCGLCVVAMARSFAHNHVPAVSADRLQGVVVLIFVAAVYGPLDFGQIAKSNWQLDRFILIDEMALILPLVMILLGSWAQQCRLPVGMSEIWPGPVARARFAMTVARHQLVLPLAPVLVVLTASDVAQWLAPGKTNIEASFVAAVLCVLLATTPWLLRFCWRTKSFPPGNQRQELESVFHESNLSVRDILVWRTDGRIANAVLAGMLPGCRYLFLSDELMNRLERDKLTAIVAHEVGHARHGHLMQLCLSLQIPLLSALVLQQVLDGSGVAPDCVQWCGMAGILIAWLLIHGRIAKIFEHQADVAACHILAGKRQLQGDSVSCYGDALTLAAGNATGSDWLHPSITARLSMLQYLSRNENHERRFQLQIKRLRGLLLGFAGFLLVCWIALL